MLRVAVAKVRREIVAKASSSAGGVAVRGKIRHTGASEGGYRGVKGVVNTTIDSGLL